MLRTEFTTGVAGTGKTHLFRQKILANSKYGVLTATTGTAAVNLGAVTINNFLRFRDEEDLAREIRFGQVERRVWRMRDKGQIWPSATVVIDEVSMMSARTLDLIYRAFRILEYHCPDIGLALVGDFCQLPPVSGEFAFKAECWPLFEANTTFLTKQWRQSDPEFLAALNAIRGGLADDAIEHLARAGVSYQSRYDEAFGGVALFATNKEVDFINTYKYESLPGPELIFKTKRTGEQAKEWHDAARFPDAVGLKVGAHIMVTANDTEGWTYANGDMGTILDMTESTVVVGLDRNPTEPVTVPYTTFERVDPKFDGPRWAAKRDGRIVGSISFLPVRLAYGLTIHKGQGLTLDRVQFDVTHRTVGRPAMAYVAMSRVRTPAGLRIIGNKDTLRKKIKVSDEVRKWI